jgi:hypothetical protein
MRVTIQSRTGSHPPQTMEAIAIRDNADTQFDLRIYRVGDQPLLVNSDYDRIVVGETDQR